MQKVILLFSFLLVSSAYGMQNVKMSEKAVQGLKTALAIAYPQQPARELCAQELEKAVIHVRVFKMSLGGVKITVKNELTGQEKSMVSRDKHVEDMAKTLMLYLSADKETLFMRDTTTRVVCAWRWLTADAPTKLFSYNTRSFFK